MSARGVAIVTGSGRRLGFETARALQKEGFHVVALYRSRTDDLTSLQEAGAETLQVDLSDPRSVDSVIAQLQQQHPRVEVLINNASEFTPDSDAGDDLAGLTARLFQVNATAPIQLMDGLAPQLKAAGTDEKPSLVINITDIFTEKPNPRFASYCASKAALSNATLSYARSLAPRVRVNAIMPGPIKFLDTHTPEQKEKVLSETLLSREGGFQPVVAQILALVDNHFMTGALIPVDGGRRLA